VILKRKNLTLLYIYKSAVRFCSYTIYVVCSTIGLLSNSYMYALVCVLCIECIDISTVCVHWSSENNISICLPYVSRIWGWWTVRIRRRWSVCIASMTGGF